MSNNKPAPLRRTFDDLLNTSIYFQEAMKRNRNALERFFSNNAYLLSLANKSVYRQLKDISEQSGFNISNEVYHGLKVGKRNACNTAIVYVIGHYWGIDGDTMLHEDLTKQDIDVNTTRAAASSA